MYVIAFYDLVVLFMMNVTRGHYLLIYVDEMSFFVHRLDLFNVV